jgi:hypothetical protein
MGHVFLAEDGERGGEVAIKVVTELGASNPQILARFEREARIMARVRHPHLIQVLDCDTSWTPPYLVLEFVAGQDLDSRLKKLGPLPLDRALRIGSQIASATDALHEAGILHRDLKPANIMLREDGEEAVVMDLGLARADDSTVLTETGSILGTPLFAAPEMLLGERVTAFADQYALGAILYQAATGRPFVRARTFEELAACVLYGDEHRPSPVAGLPPEFLEAVTRATRRAPEDRFPSCQEFLRAAAGMAPTTPAPPPAPAPAPAPVPSPPAPVAPTPATDVPSFVSTRVIAGVLALAVLLGLFTGGNHPEDVHLRVVGDTVVAEVTPAGAKDLRLEAPFGVAPPEPAPGESDRVRLVLRGLPPGEDVPVQLRWRGGEGAKTMLRAEPAALGPGPRVGPAKGLHIDVVRPVSVGWETEPSTARPAQPGRLVLEPPGSPAPWTLAWWEGGVTFTRPVSLRNLLTAETRRILAVAEGHDPLAPFRKAGELPNRDATRPLEAPSELLATARDWVPRMLSAPGPREPRTRLLEAWQRWEAASALAAAQGGPGGLAPLPLPETTAGGRGLRRAAPRGESRPPLARVGGVPGPTDEILLTSRAGKRFALGRYIDAAEAASFAWPEHPRDPGTLLSIELEVRRLDTDVAYVITTDEGTEGPHLSFWGPRPGPHDKRGWSGWLAIRLPADLAPPAGTRGSIRAVELLEPRACLVHVRGLRVAW